MQLRLWLIAIGGLLALVYGAATLYGPFRPWQMVGFFPLFGLAFVLYALATWAVMAATTPHRTVSATLNDSQPTTLPNLRATLLIVFGFAALFNGLLLPALPTLSDDMYRYIWDGRVQASGVNPYRYPSDAPELTALRDPAIWARMNRPSAITVYPPGAELAFAFIWRLFPDSISGLKAVMIATVLLAGALLTRLLVRNGQNPLRVLIFLWNPLLIFEIAHSAHVDALYLPLIVGALLLRLTAPVERISLRYEVGIGVLIGLATLIKLYPLILLPALWAVRRPSGRVWRQSLVLPLAALFTIAGGYGLYIAPGVDTLGFLSSYTREFFNIAPLPLALIHLAEAHSIAYYLPSSLLLPLLVGALSLIFIVRPAATGAETVQRAMWPIALYVLVSINLFSWYVLWLLPFVTLLLGRTHFAALGWWLFSGLITISYTLFITGYAPEWAAWVEFIPLYALLAAAAVTSGLTFIRSRRASTDPRSLEASAT